MDDGSASVFCFTPLRVPVSELGRLAVCPPAQPSSTAPVCSAPPLPEGPCPVCPRLEQEFEPWRQAAYWKAMHRRALEREAQLQAEIDRLQALLRLREQQLFGRKTETAAATVPPAPDAPAPTRRRGGRAASSAADPARNAAIIPISRPSSRTTISRSTDAVARGAVSPSPPSRAPRTARSWRSTSKPIAVSSIAGAIGPTCTCGSTSRASSRPRRRPADPQEHPRRLDLGDGAAGQVPVLPTDLPPAWPTGTRTAWTCRWGPSPTACKHLMPLFEPIYETLVKRSQGQPLWHADETRWLVFVTLRGQGRLPLVSLGLPFRGSGGLPPGRGPVPRRAGGAPRSGRGRASWWWIATRRTRRSTRSRAGLIVLAFCWAHVRRDFLDVARSWPEQEDWALGWVERIGELYRLNDARGRFDQPTRRFAAADGQLRGQVTNMREAAAERSWPSRTCTRRDGRCWKAWATTGRA